MRFHFTLLSFLAAAVVWVSENSHAQPGLPPDIDAYVEKVRRHAAFFSAHHRGAVNACDPHAGPGSAGRTCLATAELQWIRVGLRRVRLLWTQSGHSYGRPARIRFAGLDDTRAEARRCRAH